MTYRPVRGTRRNLVAPARLDEAMRKRDLNGSELARLVGTTAQTISQLRSGARQSVPADLGDAIERVLRVPAKLSLFGRPYDSTRAPATTTARRAA